MYISENIGDFAGRHSVIDVVREDKTECTLIRMNLCYIDKIRRLFAVSAYLLQVELEFTVVITVTELF